MRKVDVFTISNIIANLCKSCAYVLPTDVVTALSRCLRSETSDRGRNILNQLLDNAHVSGQGTYPLCQDTGFVVVFIDLGQDVHLAGGDLYAAINAGIAKGYREAYLRASMVADPLFERKNTDDNTPALVHLRLTPGDKIKIRIAPKGAGSENKGLLRLLPPSEGIDGVKNTVLDAVRAAGPDACPPLVVGVGIGGNMDMAALYAKRAAVRDLGLSNPDPRYAALEDELLGLVNSLGIGPQGLGGATTALKVNIEWGPTHIASLPVAVNLNCHCARHWEAVI